jgi:hypothetical protein
MSAKRMTREEARLALLLHPMLRRDKRIRKAARLREPWNIWGVRIRMADLDKLSVNEWRAAMGPPW